MGLGMPNSSTKGIKRGVDAKNKVGNNPVNSNEDDKYLKKVGAFEG